MRATFVLSAALGSLAACNGVVIPTNGLPLLANSPLGGLPVAALLALQAAVILAFLKEDKSPIYPDPLPLEPGSRDGQSSGSGPSTPVYGYQEPSEFSYEPSESSGYSHEPSESSYNFPESSYVSIDSVSDPSESSYIPPESSYIHPESSYIHPESSYIPPESSYLPPESSYIPPESSYIHPESSYIPPESSYIPPESSYVAAESQYVSPETSYPPPSFYYTNSVYNRQKRALDADLDELNEVTKLLMSAVTHLDTDGCVLKFLCHLDTKQPEDRTMEENVFFHLFSSSSKTIASYNAAILEAREVDQAHGQTSCDEVFPTCPLAVEELGSLLRQTSGCSSSRT